MASRMGLLPLNENDMLLTPPEVRAWGRVFLISATALM